MPTTSRTLTILDPTSLLGREVTERIAGAMPDVRRSLFHTAAEGEHLIAEVAGEATLVAPLLDLDEIEESWAVLVTSPLPERTATAFTAWLRERPSVALLDCTQPGIATGEAATVIDALPAEPRALPWYHLIDPSLAAPARWLRALLPLEPEAFLATLLSPVAGFGAEAIDELAAQGSARLSGRPAPRPAHLPAVLAFDLAPAHAERQAAAEAQMAEIFPRVHHDLHVVDAGVFHGNLATVHLRSSASVSLESARTLLRSVPGLRLARRNETPTASGALGETDVVCGGLRVQGPWVGAWLFADGLRVGGANAVLNVLESLSAS